MLKPKILVVDDQDYLRMAVCLSLRDWGYSAEAVGSGPEAIEKLRDPKNEYGVIILDYCMPEMNGGETARIIRTFNQETTIIVFSATQEADDVLDSFESGAINFVKKGADDTNEKLKSAVEKNCRKYQETLQTLKNFSGDTDKIKLIESIGMVGRSDELAQVAESAINYASKKDNVLIIGSTGVGKEKVARSLHKGGEESYYPVDCSAYTNNSNLMEAELFGYEKGAFTGSLPGGKVGIFECARGGTVFLDEVHNLTLNAQKGLLRALQERKIRRVGGTKEYDVNFRLVCAGKPDLKERCERGEFLPDLYYRLDVLTILVPDLKMRKDDIEPLVLYFTEKYNKANGDNKSFLMKTVRYLETYSWPGNVRELDNTVRKLLANAKQKTIDPKDLPSTFFEESSVDLSYADLEKKHEAEKKNLLISTLDTTSWKGSQAASKLGIPASTMYDLMAKFGIPKKRSAQVLVKQS